MADTAPPKKATPPPKVEGKEVAAGDGKTMVLVVEPEQDEEVAEDPEFQAASEYQGVSKGMKASKRAKASRKPKKVKPKHLTKNRPYKLEPFVSARVREIRKMEKMMDAMRDDLDRRRGKDSARTKLKNKQKDAFNF